MTESRTHVYVHGGVSGTDKPLVSLAHALVEAIAAATALDGVEEAVRRLEDDSELNAGWGSVLNRKGVIELDAGIADGTTGHAGGVVGVSVRYPVSLARRVMTSTPHVLMAGEGAMALGESKEVLDGTTERQIERYRRARDSGKLEVQHYGADEHVDTVGAVAVDSSNHLAAASSTGGVFGKLPGRVGDSAIFGAGTYASPDAAVVGTGVGELFLETLASARVARLIEEGAHPQIACERVIAYLGTRSDAPAGLLALAANGQVGAAYRGGSWAVEGPSGPLGAVRLE
ncbi:MAG TPA: isoaspartyl peptidase/L-asparaginase [Actinomycetota bacterium]|nr:isoaspartyl peptidase/L-asparaginase [Actinomycetota bacterium]